MPPKKPAAKKAAPKKAKSAKRPAPKKAAPKKAAPKKAAPKKSTPAAKKSNARTAAKAPVVSTKSSAAARTSFAQWYWEADHGNWSPYDIKQNQTMEEALEEAERTGVMVVQLSFNNWDYDIDFKNMVQMNRTTKRRRKMKRETLSATTATVSKTKSSASGKRQRAVQKGHGVVDPLSGLVDSCHVYESAKGDVYQCTLNQTNIATNNNKFYVLQLLEKDDSAVYYLFTRWGRVGVDGQMLTEQYSSLSAAIKAYEKKFRDKTLNDWGSRDSFTKVPGKYFLMQIDYTGDENKDDDDEGGSTGNGPKRKAAKTEGAPTASAPLKVTSQLPTAVQDLMKMIGSKEAMTSAMKELDIDTSRMPLGKISKVQIKQAYGYLQTIEQELKKKNPKVEEATALFYTLIPHDFGFRRPPLINSTDMLKDKMDMLEALGQLEIAARLLDSSAQTPVAPKHPFDATYEKLHCDIVPLDKNGDEFKRVVQYAKNTQGKTHTAFRIEVDEVFALNRSSEVDKYKAAAKKVGNRHMLWHGSRTTNYMGILSQGLRIAPPEAPVTGYMFGKGVYFADCCSKSANYCWPTRTSNTGLMLLCEVALGKPHTLTAAQYMTKPPKGFDSTKGIGMNQPNEEEFKEVDGVTWPMGKMQTTKAHSSLLYPEYIIYDTDQCKMEYLVKMRFHFK